MDFNKYSLLVVVLLCFVTFSNTAFFECNLYTDKPANFTLSPLESDEPIARCALMRVPLNQVENQNDESLMVFVKELPASNPDSKKNLFLLQGAVESSEGLEPLMDKWHKELPDFNIIYIEHRGTGRSTRTECYAVEAESLGSEKGRTVSETELLYCANSLINLYPDYPKYMTTSNAAYDVLSVIEKYNTTEYPGNENYIYGKAYGSLWASRILQILSEQEKTNMLKGVVFDSPFFQGNETEAPSNLPDLMTTINEVGLKIVEKCASETSEEEELCGNLFRSGEGFGVPFKFTTVKKWAQEAFDRMFEPENDELKSCGTELNIKATELKAVLSESFLQNTSTIPLIPALLFRMVRCSEQLDFGVFQKFSSVVKEYKKLMRNAEKKPLTSPILKRHIVYNEDWNNTDDQTALYKYMNETLASSFITIPLNDWQPNFMQWKKLGLVKQDKYYGKTFKNVDLNILILSGKLDRFGSQARKQYNNLKESCPNANFIEFDYAGHVTLETATDDCPNQIATSFFSQGGDFEKIEKKCLETQKPIDFIKGNADMNNFFFGVDDIWNGIYVPEEEPATINLWVFIGAVAAIAVPSIIIISSLVYYLVRLHDKIREKRYSEVGDEE